MPAPRTGFLGPGHTAVEVVGPGDLVATDPFVLLMDDRIDFAAGRKVGEAHPHAGLETVTLTLEGGLFDRDEGSLAAGDLVWMTAGRGVVHGEYMFATGTPTRALQLWLTLPERDRHAPPRLDVLRVADLPVHRASGVQARLYSGSTHGLTAPTRNHVPVTLVDVRLEAGVTFEQALPRAYNGFLYPLAGEVRVGGTGAWLTVGEIGWLDRREDDGPTRVDITAGPVGARVLLYAGQRQNEPTIHHGPFVAGSESTIVRMYHDYRAGRFVPVSQLEHLARRDA
ncbi:pirin family protein [Nannocystis pusilla]|uniref:Pirin family protein n=1 Tax=Nannocystis pusilla TaxID=889268 RepID=A0ABS7TX80_9BACT|nr:pirin-like C-terminal cupin domain-containing protein [Nannocystis pusilla]MBZ5712868.1 pirin family protein [Nannocystis pusilla]